MVDGIQAVEAEGDQPELAICEPGQVPSIALSNINLRVSQTGGSHHFRQIVYRHVVVAQRTQQGDRASAAHAQIKDGLIPHHVGQALVGPSLTRVSEALQS